MGLMWLRLLCQQLHLLENPPSPDKAFPQLDETFYESHLEKEFHLQLMRKVLRPDLLHVE